MHKNIKLYVLMGSPVIFWYTNILCLNQANRIFSNMHNFFMVETCKNLSSSF
jgi:hypothetical protein